MEKFDVYNDDRCLTGKTLVRGEKCGKGENRMVIHICIFNSNGEILIQQRQPFKSSWANMWDISVGGSSQCGESSKDAAKRELKEELGIDFDFSQIRPHLTMNFENGFDDFYILNFDVDLNTLILQQEEVQSVKWATKEEIIELIKENKFIPYCEEFISLLFDLRLKRGILK